MCYNYKVVLYKYGRRINMKFKRGDKLMDVITKETYVLHYFKMQCKNCRVTVLFKADTHLSEHVLF